MPLFPGQATAEGTRAFADRSINSGRTVRPHFRKSSTGLDLSSLGLGTYIGPPDAPTDLAVEQAVTVCLQSGRINAIDTAINYRYQRAERSIGRAIGRTIERGDVAREEVFVATKHGYFAPDGESTLAPDEWVQHELVDRGVLTPEDIVEDCHSMSVSYLTDQFQRSRHNLGLNTIDLVYLHNAADVQLSVVGRSEFLQRLSEALALYERFRREGLLGSYGLATWDCLRVPRSSPMYLSLETAIGIARQVGGEDHGLRYLQFPFNLAMPEAAQLRNQTVGKDRLTLLEAARRLHLSCFTSVPLFQGQLARTGPRDGELTPAQTAIQFARSAPGSMGPLVGQKNPAHLAENLGVCASVPWDEEKFRRMLP